MENKAVLVKTLPDKPGVYFFKTKKKLLYIGKATSLKDRVKSYFNKDIVATRGPKIEKMIALADSVEFEETNSVLEALILEAALIKKHQPEYNTREKDDKSFWSVIITKEDWPRLLSVRGKDLITDIDPDTIKYSFGPFPHGSELKEALKIIRRIFPYRDKCEPESGKPCFNRQIGLCPGVCSGEISKADYAKVIRNLKLFFDGKKSELIKTLEKEMKQLAKLKKFELAAKIRNQIFALNHIRDVALIKNQPTTENRGFKIEAYDIAHLSGQDTVGVMVVSIGNDLDKTSYRKFKLKGLTKNKADDTANLAEVLQRRFTHQEWRYPDLIVVDGGQAQINRAKKVLAGLDVVIPVVSVVKDERHKPRDFMGDEMLIKKYESEILLANNEAHRFALAYHRNRRDRMVK
ncbi:MAG: UvrB/UvrC motif-containing protein [Candidatus Vogelbacteria bacterium]|nr:UvrB/UvrC motif-containing protein [Candidatus Vogelbacteria bacterium]